MGKNVLFNEHSYLTNPIAFTDPSMRPEIHGSQVRITIPFVNMRAAWLHSRLSVSSCNLAAL